MRTERSFVEMRQLKICATCFDISVGLLRVLEMVVNVAGNIFLDETTPSAELLLGRLYQVRHEEVPGYLYMNYCPPTDFVFIH